MQLNISFFILSDKIISDKKKYLVNLEPFITIKLTKSVIID